MENLLKSFWISGVLIILMALLFSLLIFTNVLIYIYLLLFSHSVQLFATPWTAACWASLSFTISWHFLKLMSIE